ncbi:hypothetical protein AB6A40_009219 [Gnathostoma spinigerum]|uniref:UAS domain-containing protein n=1 Tax=Gnathostoma spinigerum TaxID=75299 RepID=A0ABD6ESI8_9BILA
MTEPSENDVQSFISFTGNSDEKKAREYLEACSHNVAMAVDLYFHRQGNSSPSDVQGCSTSGRSRQSVSVSRHSPNASLSARTVNNTESRSTNQEKACTPDNDDIYEMEENHEVRAPIAPVRGVIVEQTFRQQYQTTTRRRTNSVFDAYRDFRTEAEEQLAALRSGSSAPVNVNRRASLQSLFRPPFELLFRGDWESARAEARRRGEWLLVNIQNAQEFACQALNRDVWSHASVRELITSNFLLWQVYSDSPDGNRISNYYNIHSYPAVFIIDPRTGEHLTKIRAADPATFCEQLTTFLEDFPNYDARDRHLIGVAAPVVSTDPTPSMSTAEDSSTDVKNISSLAGIRMQIRMFLYRSFHPLAKLFLFL